MEKVRSKAVVKSLTVAGTTVGPRQAHLDDASAAHTLNATYSAAEVKAALDALGTKLNAVITALEAFGVLADS